MRYQSMPLSFVTAIKKKVILFENLFINSLTKTNSELVIVTVYMEAFEVRAQCNHSGYRQRMLSGSLCV